ncbi:hypothetical protein BDP27DRAFT_1419817 [Rhodocollybia butyracea]|uniref:Transmembrane protein n=1 Tax=Rhodocollybia butyracea TaxID=206335 RepID=A0A9P5U926_9AGAR|nr:hypothetical protein BDP27DRAFT_1419817 [Rhodocollybia butyracea]
MSSSTTASPSAPLPAIVHDSSAPSSPVSDIDAFFGYNFSTRDSQHDRRLSLSAEELPAYVEPPAYEIRQTEPATLAMFLFKFGFLFPPFWIMGAFILLSPLRAPESSLPPPPSSLSSSSSSADASSASSLPASWLPEKTPAERELIVSKMRSVEVKWAKRCLYALCILGATLVAVGLTIWAVLRISRGLEA